MYIRRKEGMYYYVIHPLPSVPGGEEGQSACSAEEVGRSAGPV